MGGTAEGEPGARTSSWAARTAIVYVTNNAAIIANGELNNCITNPFWEGCYLLKYWYLMTLDAVNEAGKRSLQIFTATHDKHCPDLIC